MSSLLNYYYYLLFLIIAKIKIPNEYISLEKYAFYSLISGAE